MKFIPVRCCTVLALLSIVKASLIAKDIASAVPCTGVLLTGDKYTGKQHKFSSSNPQTTLNLSVTNTSYKGYIQIGLFS